MAFWEGRSKIEWLDDINISLEFKVLSSLHLDKMSAVPSKVSKKVSQKKDAEVVAPVAVAVAEVAPTPAPVVKKSKKVVAEAVVPSTPAVTAQPVVEDAAPVEEASWQEELATLQAELTKIRDAAASALTLSKKFEKRMVREMKQARKNRRKSRAPLAEGEERKPSIFEIPVPITDELSTFLGNGKGVSMSRSQVTKAVSAYVKENKLNEKHKIHPDPALRKLLGVKEGDELTIFNMQTYLQKHYVKPVATA
jgi:chromatin remodeling complex protein RSC6